MILQPCVRCSFRQTCELKRETLRKARGLPLSAAKIRCPIRLAGLQNGQRVKVKIFNAVQVPGGYLDEGPRYEPREYTGTVLQPSKKGHKLLVWLDEPLETVGGQQTGRVRVNVHHDNLTAIDGFDPICGECSNPKSKRADSFCQDQAWHAILHPSPVQAEELYAEAN